MDLLLEYKWFFLVGAEASFWALCCVFVALRYLFDLDGASVVVLALMILDNLFIAGLGLLDLARTGEFAVYQAVALAIIVYGLAFGKRDLRRLDAYLKRKVAARRGESAPAAASRETAPETASRAVEERRGFYGHVALFAAGQLVLLAMGESWLAARLVGSVPEELSALMSLGRVWCVILFVDGVWSLSYTVFPEGKGAR